MPEVAAGARQKSERQLSVVLAADVVGYSRLMQQDEDGTFARLRDARATVIDPQVASHRGRIFKTMGDGLLVEFPSVIEAVTCAVAVQREMTAYGAKDQPDIRIELRIGINIGDMIREADDVFGDGVHIAARLAG